MSQLNIIQNLILFIIILPFTPTCFSWPLSQYLPNKILFTVLVSPMLAVNML